jgi:hypothetical protein
MRLDCLVAGVPMELEAHGRRAPAGVTPGATVRVKPVRPKVYAVG